MTRAGSRAGTGAGPSDVESGYLIDCGTCVMRSTDACRECVVTAIVNPPEGAIVFDAAEERAIRAMGTAGLLPLVRYRPGTEAV
ncbi:MAG TPA: hypothetical protein VGB64_01285 [Actinomycetota bacterium]